MARARFPKYVYGRGQEPDPRFTLANERTFLAWIRTSLALLAVGVALEALALPVHPTLRLIASVVLLTLGLLAAAHAWWTWSRTELALRLNQPLPSSGVAAPVALGVVLVAALIAIGLFL